MKTERPILFSGAMVRAVLEGRKTQTRRVVKPQSQSNSAGLTHYKGCLVFEHDIEAIEKFCPYGQLGDRLWVRENWSHTGEAVWSVADARSRGRGGVIYQATDAEPCPGCWWPSIHMPREFSRILLEITGVRVERLQEISEMDARAEGVPAALEPPNLDQLTVNGWEWMPYTTEFRGVWEDIYGPEAWNANPWVWVVEFKRVEGEVGADAGRSAHGPFGE